MKHYNPNSIKDILYIWVFTLKLPLIWLGIWKEKSKCVYCGNKVNIKSSTYAKIILPNSEILEGTFCQDCVVRIER
jgi:hypothetical protein